MTESLQKWNELVARARTDRTFRARLDTEPVAALRELGIDVPAGVEVRVVENTARLQYLVLPAASALEDLEVSEPADVRGGAALKVSLAPVGQPTDIFGGGSAAKAFRIQQGR